MIYNITALCVSTYQSFVDEALTGTYYELSEGSEIYIERDGKIGVLRKGSIENNCNGNNLQYCALSIEDVLASTETNYSTWILYNSVNDNQILAYCEDDSSYSCNNWMVWNQNIGEYISDSSFDIDENTCIISNIKEDYVLFNNGMCYQFCSLLLFPVLFCCRFKPKGNNILPINCYLSFIDQ